MKNGMVQDTPEVLERKGIAPAVDSLTNWNYRIQKVHCQWIFWITFFRVPHIYAKKL